MIIGRVTTVMWGSNSTHPAENHQVSPPGVQPNDVHPPGPWGRSSLVWKRFPVRKNHEMTENNQTMKRQMLLMFQKYVNQNKRMRQSQAFWDWQWVTWIKKEKPAPRNSRMYGLYIHAFISFIYIYIHFVPPTSTWVSALTRTLFAWWICNATANPESKLKAWDPNFRRKLGMTVQSFCYYTIQ